MKTNIHFRSYLLRMRNVSDKVAKKIKTRILYSVTSFSGNLPMYETRWKNIVERGRPQLTIWPMRIVCWITGATNTHSDCAIIINAFPLQQWLLERVSMLRYTST